MRILKVVSSLAMAVALATSAMAADTKPYKQGQVTEISYVKVKPGKIDEYMKFLAGSWKQLREAQKKEGLITGYAIFQANPRTASDPDLILSITYPNMAALDKEDEFDAVSAKVNGSRDTQMKAVVDREAMREILGRDLLREIVLK